MSEITRDRRFEILRSLGSTECGGCGKEKKPKMSHCRKCYYALSPTMRQSLYRQFGSGYEEAYEASLRYLNQSKVTA